MRHVLFPLVLTLAACSGGTDPQVEADIAELQDAVVALKLKAEANAELAARLEAAETRVAELENDLAFADADIDDLKADVASLGDVGNLGAKISEIDDRVTVLETSGLATKLFVEENYVGQDDIDAVSASVTTLGATVLDLEARVSAAEGSVTTIVADTSGWATTIDDQTARIEALEEADLDFTDALTELEVEIGSISTGADPQVIIDLQDAVDNLEDAQIDVDGRFEAIETATADLETGLAGFESAQEEMQATLADLVDANLGIDGRFTDLEGRADALETAFAGGQATITGLTADVADLKSRTGVLETADTNFTAALGAVNADITDINDRVDDAVATLGGLGERVDDVETSVGGFDGQIAALDKTVGDLESQVGALDTTVATFDGRISDAEDNLDDQDDRLTDAEDHLDQTLYGVLPAIYEWRKNTYGLADTGGAGLLLYTSDGAFQLSGAHAGPAAAVNNTNSTQVHYVTFYVTNPGASASVIPLTMTGSEVTRIYVDDVQVYNHSVALFGDWLAQPVDLTVPAGAHKVTFYASDKSRSMRGIGVKNPWIVDGGLELDWETTRAALSGGL
jgi:septal ring factor EnvC (AmiA/AmiB activator)